jgi:hypothetical protein
MTDERRFYEAAAGADARRSAPAALRNRQHIAEVLREWLPESGVVLEVASGTGEHALYFAEQFSTLEWQPSDVDPQALVSIAAWREASGPPNVRPPLRLDASAHQWPIERADTVLNINMVHISPWSAALGLLAGAAKALASGGPLILYGPWLKDDVPTAASNVAFDRDLKARDPEWGLRRVEDFAAAAETKGFKLKQTRAMPANNLMLLLHPERTNR